MIETAFNKTDLVEKLSVGSHKIEFYKLDGSVRKMNCTRDTNLIPGEDHPKSTSRATASTVVTVYDLDDSAWKSFIVENLICIDKE